MKTDRARRKTGTVRDDPLKDIRSTHGKELLGKRVVLCVTGSVASIESPTLARELMRHGAEVFSVMSPAAAKLLRPDLLEWATGNPVVTSLTGKTEHVRLAGQWPGKAHLVLVAPCTANTISKIAMGIDDTPATTFASMALGSKIPLIICPAAHEPMYRNPSVTSNLSRLVDLGAEIVEPRFEEGKAKMADVPAIVAGVMRTLAKRDLEGKRVMITGGPTVEFIDPVRVITNLSSGMMGLSLAEEAWRRGAEVFYIFGGNLAPPDFVKSKKVLTTEDMRRAVIDELSRTKYDVFISAAAPSDFTPARPANRKTPTSQGGLTLKLVPTRKIVAEVKDRWKGLCVVGFKAETANSRDGLKAAAERFMRESRVDVVVANDVTGGKVFGSRFAEVLILTKRRTVRVPTDLKENIARRILDVIAGEIH
jgi:phosphopantothenoylcysteine decarboxylase/phosphopantothenate--cysteine ligase